jgi:hypothetical protein
LLAAAIKPDLPINRRSSPDQSAADLFADQLAQKHNIKQDETKQPPESYARKRGCSYRASQ